MPWYDLPLERLREYRTSTQEPDGLDDWWAARLREARELATPATVTAHEPGLYAPFAVSDVEFSGGAGSRGAFPRLVADGDPVGQGADRLDRHADLVPGRQRADALRGPGEQHVAGEQGHHRRHVLDQRRHVPQQLAGPRVLPDVPVDGGGDAEVGRVGGGLHPRAERAG